MTIPANKNVIKVNDVNDNDDDKKALHVINSSTDSSARALKVEGVAEIVNSNEAVALVVIGSGSSVIQAGNDENDASKLVLSIIGNNYMASDPSGNLAHITLELKNLSTHEDARALVVEGKVDIDGRIRILAGSHGNITVPDVNDNDDQSYACTLSNTSTNEAARALYAEGAIEIDRHSLTRDALIVSGQTVMSFDGTLDPRADTLKVIGSTNHLENAAFVVEGNTHLIGVPVIPEVTRSNAVLIKNESTNPASRAIYVSHGPSEFDTRIHVNDIDGGTPGAEFPTDMNIGIQPDFTNDLILSQEGQTTHVQGDLQVDEDAVLAAAVAIGPSDDDGELDSGGDAVTARKLKIGSNTGTDNLELGRNGKIVDLFLFTPILTGNF